MSITHLSVANFQSLRRVDLELGTFTVIVGPSSSGKSALMRAFRALASNVRGNGVITRGQKHMAITARTETHTVTLERTERAGTYRISDDEGNNLSFTKLAGDVPEHVTNALRIDPVGNAGSVNFSNQFDKPYLLDESGATVAHVLGELTNVTTIFDAVRAANRIRANAASTLKTRKNDLEQVKTRLGDFQGLRGRLKALEEAERLDVERQQVQRIITKLDVARRTVRIAEQALANNALPQVPAVEPLNELNNRYLDLAGKIRGLHTKGGRLQAADNEVQDLDGRVTHWQGLLTKQLNEAGVCPTCGQSVQSGGGSSGH